MAKTDTYMPVVIGDYLKDTMRLTTEQHGAFFLILMDYWTKGAPPDDDETLASIARLPLDRWMKARPVLAGFFKIEGGMWVNKRAEEELSAARAKSQKASDNAKKRWDGCEPNAPADATAMPTHMLERCSAPAPTYKDKKNKGSDPNFEEWYAAYPLHVGRGKAVKAYQAALSKADHATLLEGARRYAASPARKPEFTKHPSSWLNAECWLDDVPAAITPAPTAEHPDDSRNRARLAAYKRTGRWDENNHGPPPGDPRCWVPKRILSEFGISDARAA